MTEIVHFPVGNIAVRKAEADQALLLDLTLDGDALMERLSRVAGNPVVRSTPALRTQLGILTDWARLLQQSLDQLEQDIKDSAA
jgi:hypothetical protein